MLNILTLATMIGAIFAAALFSVVSSDYFNIPGDSGGGFRGDGGFGMQYAPTTTAAPAASWDQYVWKITDSWEETDEDTQQAMGTTQKNL